MAYTYLKWIADNDWAYTTTGPAKLGTAGGTSPMFEDFIDAMEKYCITHLNRMQHDAELFAIVEQAMATRTFEEWTKRLDQYELIYSPVQDAVDVANDEQAWANDYFKVIEHPTLGEIKLVANPIKLSKMPSSIRTTAPEMGQHTEEVLLENGYSLG